jgi:CheY-like chemotaxis protein
LRQIACSVLNALNFHVLTAADGVEALIRVAENRAELRAVITDLHMPHMDGVALVRAIKRILPDIGIIVSSGRLEPHEMIEIKRLGVSVLLDKPFSQEKLVEALKAVLSK